SPLSLLGSSLTFTRSRVVSYFPSMVALFLIFLFANMAAPRAPWIALSYEMREMSFRNGITDGRLWKIFKISCDENLVAIKAVLGEDFMVTEGLPRVNSGVASVFVENILVLHPVKAQVIKLVVLWLKPAFCGNLVEEVSNFNFLSWVAYFGKEDSQHLHLGSFIDLENRYHELLAFTESMASFARDKSSAHAQFVLPISRLCIGLWPLFRLGGSVCMNRLLELSTICFRSGCAPT
ncbi:hypothetical protein KI387_024270, partial [Taxus chinensis]